ncbi:MAG: gamma-glutamylputrescine synthetase [Gammaproteobacteria bacterium SG8_31]|jgi:glutamine synthetase|nr:MAG: gamma-glutamylputrescine synthetase [Gammaproteobacteria bacterium SG8_31]
MVDEKPDPGEARKFLEDNPEVSSIDLLIADGNGIVRGKRINDDHLEKVYSKGICLPGSIFGLDTCGQTVEETGLGFEKGDADNLCFPVPGTLTLTGWRTGAGAQLLMTMLDDDGTRFYADPRVVLGNVVDRFAELGLTPVVAVELEFYLLDTERDERGRPQPPRSPITGQRESSTQVYGMAELDDYTEFMDEVRRIADIQGVPADTAVSEYAPGQYEVNLSHLPDAIRACDHAIMLKRIVKRAANSLGMEATFMAKPYPEQSGSGMHVHVSLLDEQGNNILAGTDESGSEALRWVAGGLMETMSESMALLAPNANSYRRFQPDSFVPLAPTWGVNNRTVAIRVPAGDLQATRVEHRVAGADANPYLVMAAVLIGVHRGITKKLDPGAPVVGNAGEQVERELPSGWLHAVEAFEESEVMTEYLGENFMNVYAACKRFERASFASHVTSLEYQWYLRTV